MNINEIIEKIIYSAFDEIRETLREPEALKNSKDTALFGANSAIDSMGLVSLLIAVEEKILDETDKSVTIADEKAMSRKKSPFKNVETLAEYIKELID